MASGQQAWLAPMACGTAVQQKVHGVSDERARVAMLAWPPRLLLHRASLCAQQAFYGEPFVGNIRSHAPIAASSSTQCDTCVHGELALRDTCALP